MKVADPVVLEDLSITGTAADEPGASAIGVFVSESANVTRGVSTLEVNAEETAASGTEGTKCCITR